MEEIQIMLKYSGVWTADNVYETNKIEGIVICANTNYKKLTDEITLQLRIDQTRKKIRMRYIVEGNLIPMEIHNDMGVKLYVSLKKKICDFTKYPLCIDIIDMEIESCSSGVEVFDTVTGAIGCVDYECGLQLISSLIPLSIDDMNLPQLITDPNHKPVEVGQVYRNKKMIISVMHNFALDNRFQFYVKRSDRKSYVLICFCEDCPWIFKASCIGESDLFEVRNFNNIHTCPLNERRITQRQATTKLITAVSIPNLTNHKRKHTANDIKEDMKRIMGVNIDYQKAWRARKLVIKIIRGGPADGYLNMPRYLYMLGSFYPGSYIRLHKSPEYQFMYLFIALYPPIRGFDQCRPIVVVDESAMRGSYLGTFISASTLDGAGNILPLAYGVVDTENDTSWTWFFE